MTENVEVHPVTPDRWDDLVELFGRDRGANSGCWCLWYRIPRAGWTTGERERRNRRNRETMRGIVAQGRVPGLLAYLDGRPVGWASVAPREEFPVIERSRTTKPVDDRPAWAIVCFYIHARHRKQGVGTALLEAAVDHARANGAMLVEAYPADPAVGKIANPMAWYGLVPMFEAAGFREVARRSDRRPVMRRELRPRRKA